MEQFPSKTDRPIGMDDYKNAGGFEGALNQHADELLDSPAARAEPKFVEIIFKRLTALGRGKRERRDPAPLSELWDLCGARAEDQRLRVNSVIDVFRSGEATFLNPRKGELLYDTYIDITHESLIRNWKVLAEKWLPEEEAQAKTIVELLDRARGWRAGKKELLVGLDLSGAVDWDERRNHSAVWAKHYAEPEAVGVVEDFLSRSREQQKRSASRRTRIFAYITGGLALLLLAALFLAFVAWRASLRATKQQKLAESREVAAMAETLVSMGSRGEAIDTAVHAFSIDKTSEAREAIAHAFPQELTRLEGHSGRVESAAFSPDGQRVVTASADKTARVFKIVTLEDIARLLASK